MSSFEFNKLFAAVLVAGIVAMLGGFVAEQLIHPHELETDAVAIEGLADDAGAGGGKAAMPEPILALIATADLAKGEKLSKACTACHTFESGGAAKIGPNLYGVVGGPKAHMAGFAYSDGLKAKGGTWSYEDLNHFLWKPKKFIEGTKMNFVGIKKPEDRAAMIVWLRAQGSSSMGLPGAAAIAAEEAALAPKEEPAAEDNAVAGEGAKPAEDVSAKKEEAPVAAPAH
jgi:cytochrome c